MNYCVKDIENYIIPEHPLLAKEYLVVWIFLLSFFGIIPAICDPFVPYIFNIIIPIVIIFDVIGILLMINIWKWQKLYTLYSGIYCLTASIVLYLVFFKFVFYILGAPSNVLLEVTIGIYLLILIVSNILVLKALKDGYFSNHNKNKKKNKSTSFVLSFSGIGLIIGRLLIHTNQQTAGVIFALSFLFFSYIMVLGTHNIYKYYLIKKYESEVKIYKKDDKKKTQKTSRKKKI